MGDDVALPMDLLGRGDPGFVDAIRRVHDAEALAGLAGPWFEDRRDGPRGLLFEYLDRPLNAYRHEGLVKRLFKRAEAAGDDALMARFLVLFDRSVRRVRESGRHPARTTMPRGRMVPGRGIGRSAGEPSPDWAVRFGLDWAGELGRPDIADVPGVLEKLRPLRLFTLATRRHLRRRAWRYFRKLGRSAPDRYVAAVSEALALYRDADVADSLALLDNWGLIHILFHHGPTIEAGVGGWTTRPGHEPGRLTPSPIFEDLWKEAPRAVIGLLVRARSATVRRWAIRRVEADMDLHRPCLPASDWVGWLGHADPEVVALVARMLGRVEGFEGVEVGRWLAMAESTAPSALGLMAGLMARHVDPDEVTLAQAVRLAGLGALPMARLGFSWLGRKAVGPGDLGAVRVLVEAGSRPIRPEILGWLRGVLAGSSGFEPSMVLDFLDSRHADVRAEGWKWFLAEPRASADPETWRKLLESPHDEIRLALAAELERRAGGADDPSRVGRGLDPEALRPLWAGVLLGVRGGSRAKPGVVRQLARRLEESPGEADEWLPLLGVALRSCRGPERRAGLVAIVRLVEAREELRSLVRSSFPELQID